MKKSKAFLIRELVCAGFVYAFATWIMICTFSMGSYTQNRLSPAFVPRIISFALYGLGTIILVRGLLKARKEKAADIQTEETAEPAAENIQEEPVDKEAVRAKKVEPFIPYATLLLVMLYLILMKRIGFTVSSVLFLTCQITLLSGKYTWKSLLKYFIIALVASVIIWLVFYKALSLGLPVNDWGF